VKTELLNSHVLKIFQNLSAFFHSNTVQYHANFNFPRFFVTFWHFSLKICGTKTCQNWPKSAANFGHGAAICGTINSGPLRHRATVVPQWQPWRRTASGQCRQPRGVRFSDWLTASVSCVAGHGLQC
jgi:hypothetical protein